MENIVSIRNQLNWKVCFVLRLKIKTFLLLKDVIKTSMEQKSSLKQRTITTTTTKASPIIKIKVLIKKIHQGIWYIITCPQKNFLMVWKNNLYRRVVSWNGPAFMCNEKRFKPLVTMILCNMQRLHVEVLKNYHLKNSLNIFKKYLQAIMATLFGHPVFYHIKIEMCFNTR